MDREIKFRAWNGEQMISPDYISRSGTGFWTENSIPSYSTELMQFTGLRDKNEVDIYEGDVAANSVGEKGIIMYGDGVFYLSYFQEPAMEYLCLFVIRDKQYNSTNKCSIKVIGNIYKSNNK